MNTTRANSLLTAFAAALVAVSTPSTASACCWLHDLFHHDAPTTTFLPVQPPCGACGQTACGQTCGYVPQTAYRTVYTAVPMTTYRPVVVADPYTGCPVTTMRPVTAYVQRPTVVAYTTYMPVAQPACSTCASPCSTCGSTCGSPCSSCGGGCSSGTCASGACGAPATTTYYQGSSYQPSAGCSSCNAGLAQPQAGAVYQGSSYQGSSYQGSSYQGSSPTTGYASPGPLYGQPSPAPMQQGPGMNTIPATPQPSLNQGTNIGGSSAFQQSGASMPLDSRPIDSGIKPIPDNGAIRQNATPTPRTIEPNDQTTSLPVMRAWAYTPIAWPNNDVSKTEVSKASSTQKPGTEKIDDSGWRAARR